MAFQSSVAACAVNFSTLAGAYYLGKNQRWSLNSVQCLGVGAAAIFNSVRPYSDRYLREKFEGYNLDCIHGTASVLLIGAAGAYGEVPWETNLVATIVFTGLQMGVHKFSSYLFNTRNDYCETSTFRNAIFLKEQLFPRNNGYGALENSVSAYLYVLPDGFFVFLSVNERLPFFTNRMGSVDGSEVCKMQEEFCGSFSVSAEAIARLKVLAKQVAFDGAQKEWELEGVPPFICMEGQWNDRLNRRGGAVDWEGLIKQGLTQEHEAFSLKLLPATWTTKKETPDLRGFSFNHSESRFNIWVHEKNTQALKSAQRALGEEKKFFQTLIDYLCSFEEAAYSFFRDGLSNPLQIQKRVGLATRGSPFLHLTAPYKDLAEKLKSYRKSKKEEKKESLKQRFREFFITLPRIAHFEADSILTGKFNACFRSFQESGNDLVRKNGYVDIKALREWTDMIQRVFYCFDSTEETKSLIADCNSYLAIHEQLRKKPDNAEELRNQQVALEPTLKKGYALFFEKYKKIMRGKGKFVQHLEREIGEKQKTEAQLKAYMLCEQDLVSPFLFDHQGGVDVKILASWDDIFGGAVPDSKEYLQKSKQLKNGSNSRVESRRLKERLDELYPVIIEGYSQLFAEGFEDAIGVLVRGYLVEEGGALKKISLKVWTDILKLSRVQSERCQELIDNCATYLRDSKQDNLVDQIIEGYAWFFGTYMINLPADQKNEWLQVIDKSIKCPRSYTKSTAQIAYYSDLEPSHFHAIIRRNRSRQIAALKSAIESHLNDVKNNIDLPVEFCPRLRDLYERVSAFMVRKAQNFKTLEQEWEYDKEKEGGGEIKHQAMEIDESEYQFDFDKQLARQMRNGWPNGRPFAALFNEITSSLFNLHTLVNQVDEEVYLKSPFLKEEAEITTGLYTLANDMAFLLKVPMTLYLHQELHKHSVQTNKAKKALEEDRYYSIYKRIGNGGEVLWDIVRKGEKSVLEKEDTLHTAIFNYA